MTGSKPRIEWNKQPLGEMSDGQIARLLGVSRNAVISARVRRGIAACKQYRRNRPRQIDWSAQPLGSVPDHEIAKAVGCSNSSVSLARKRLGIEPYTDKVHALGIDWDQQPLGVCSDAEIACRLECNTTSVRAARLKRGIAPVRRRERVAPQTGGVEHVASEGH